MARIATILTPLLYRSSAFRKATYLNRIRNSTPSETKKMVDYDAPKDPSPSPATEETALNDAPVMPTEEPASNDIPVVPEPIDQVRNLETISHAVIVDVERLASWFERTRKPYAHRKAATLRRENTKLIALLKKLAEFEGGGREDAARVSGELPDESAVAESALGHEPIIDDGDKADTPQQDNGVGQHHRPSPPPAAGTSHNENESEDYTTTTAAQQTSKTAANNQQLVAEAQDIALISRLVMAKQMLQPTAPAMAEAVGAFGLRFWGEAAWGERIRYYAGHHLGGEVGYAKVYLEETANVLSTIDEGAAGELRGIVSAFAV